MYIHTCVCRLRLHMHRTYVCNLHIYYICTYINTIITYMYILCTYIHIHTYVHRSIHVPYMYAGRAKSVKRFERSNGLDTALYKNYFFTHARTLSYIHTYIHRPAYARVHMHMPWHRPVYAYTYTHILSTNTRTHTCMYAYRGLQLYI